MAIVAAGRAECARLQGYGLGGEAFGELAIGRSSTAVADGQTALVDEITTGGGARKTGGDVTVSLETGDVTGDTVRFLATFSFTAAFGVLEFGVFNTTTMLLRQVFASVFNVVVQDVLTMQVDVQSSDHAAGSDSVLTDAGLAEGNRHLGAGLTPASGRMRYLAVGSGSTALAKTQTALVTEITTGGLARKEATVTLDTETTTDDTVKLEATWSVTGTQAVREAGVFSLASGGTMWLRQLFASVLNLVATDTLVYSARIPQVTQ